MVARLVEKAKKQLKSLSFSTLQKGHYFFGWKNMNFVELILNFCFKKLMRKER